jgi:UDP-N-acetyl-D-galactosamine dehydrogenase
MNYLISVSLICFISFSQAASDDVYLPEFSVLGSTEGKDSVNDFIPTFIAKKVAQTLIELGKNPGKARVLVMGVTFKEEVSDIRNSKVVDLIKELQDYSIEVDVIDPNSNPVELQQHYGLALQSQPSGTYDAIVLAVGHAQYRNMTPLEFKKLSNAETLLFDIKGVMNKKEFKNYWRL